MDATAVFTGIGLAYILTALVYRLPIPVQPLKSLSALALALGLPPVIIISGAIWNAIAFLGMGLTRADRLVQKAFPKAVIRGIQLGLAWLLFKSAWKLVSTAQAGWQDKLMLFRWAFSWSWLLAGGAVVLLLILIWLRRDWAALGVVAFGVIVSILWLGLPPLSLQITLPKLLPLIPNWSQLLQGLWVLALPQIPLSLGNSIYATADAARQYFGEKANRVTERKLMLTMGFNDAVTALIGGVPVCHGCGGLTAHYRLGARTGGAPLMIGTLFLALGLVGGKASTPLFGLIPFPVLGILLAYVGLQHMLLSRDLRGWREWLTALVVLALTVWTSNLAIGFLSAALFYYIWGWFTSRFQPPVIGL